MEYGDYYTDFEMEEEIYVHDEIVNVDYSYMDFWGENNLPYAIRVFYVFAWENRQKQAGWDSFTRGHARCLTVKTLLSYSPGGLVWVQLPYRVFTTHM